MVPTPATNGAKVRTIGTKRAYTIALPPCFSKNFCVFSRCDFLRKRYLPLKAAGPMYFPT